MTLEVVNEAVIGGVSSVVMFFGILLFLWIGRRLGQRAIPLEGAAPATVGSLETAVFALLGLIIAFTLAGALTRFDLRRAQAVEEANAIGTAYLRLDLLPAAAQPKLRETFRRYVDSRIATYHALPDIAAARAEVVRSQAIQSEIWAQAVAAAAMPATRVNVDVVVLPALNQMFDITTVRLVATQMHPPLILYLMLIGLGFAAALLAGYQTAGGKAYGRLHQVGFAGIIAFTVYVILDIEYPRLGFIRLDAIDRLLVDVRAGMK